LFRVVVVLTISYTIALLSRHFLELPVLSLKRFLADSSALTKQPAASSSS
jgi:hypothetical protein